MDTDILPDPAPVPPAPVPEPTPEPIRQGRPEIRCEFCKSKLDRRGNLMERGPKVREMMEAEDTIADLRKQLAKAKEAHELTRGELAKVSADLARFTSRKFGQVAK